MKKTMKTLSLAAIAIALSACGGQQAQENTLPADHAEAAAENVRSYGEVITAEGIIDPLELNEQLSVMDTVECTLSATIKETCVKKGCWMTLDAGLEDEMRVRFVDYGFFIPTEGQSGKKTVVRGIAYKDVTTVDDLKHYAEDAGKSQEEIDAITEPEVSVSFLADGVLIYD